MRTSTRLLPADAARAFQPTADRASLWLTGQYDDALRVLRGAALGRQGLLALVGEGGTGKSVLAHALAVRVREDPVVVGRLLYPILEGMDLLAAVAEAFGLPSDFKDRQGFLDQLRRFVAETAEGGRRVLLVVDEAQRLNNDLLVELGRLPYEDGAAPTSATLSVLLVGQRGVLDALRAAGVEPDALCHLRPLTREQTAEYVAHRLRVAGGRGRLFTPSALRKIWVVSEGIPRAVNALCIDALDYLRLAGGRVVTAAMVDRPLRAVDEPAEAPASRTAAQPVPAIVPPTASSIPPRAPGRPRRRAVWLTAAAVAGVILGAAWGVTRSERVPWSSALPQPMSPPTPAQATPRPVDEAAAAAAEPAGSGAATIPAEHVARPDLATAPAPQGVAPEPERTVPPQPERTETILSQGSATPAALLGPPRPRPQAQRRPETVASPRSAEDDGDAGALIDWLLRSRRAAGGNP